MTSEMNELIQILRLSSSLFRAVARDYSFWVYFVTNRNSERCLHFGRHDRATQHGNTSHLVANEVEAFAGEREQVHWPSRGSPASRGLRAGSVGRSGRMPNSRDRALYGALTVFNSRVLFVVVTDRRPRRYRDLFHVAKSRPMPCARTIDRKFSCRFREGRDHGRLSTVL